VELRGLERPDPTARCVLSPCGLPHAAFQSAPPVTPRCSPQPPVPSGTHLARLLGHSRRWHRLTSPACPPNWPRPDIYGWSGTYRSPTVGGCWPPGESNGVVPARREGLPRHPVPAGRGPSADPLTERATFRGCI